MRINIWMDPELHKKLKIVAALKGETIQNIIACAIEASVKNDKKIVKKLFK